MDDVLLDTSRLFIVVPVKGEFSSDASGRDDHQPFVDIDSDIDVPDAFFKTLKRRALSVAAQDVDASEDPNPIWILGAELVGVGSGGSAAQFLVVDAAPDGPRLATWLEVARRASKTEWAEALCRACGVEPRRADTRGIVLTSLVLAGTPDPEQVNKVALHLATRAPFSERLIRVDGAGEVEISGVRYRVVTRRTCGFVTGDTGGSDFFDRKFHLEVEHQYLVAVILSMWQLLELSEILSKAQGIWDDDPSDSQQTSNPLARSGSLRRRVTELNDLRARYARLTGTGSFGPVFDSGSQSRFWTEVQEAMGIRRRYDEVRDALANLSDSTETQASLNLERLLAFFTLVIGVPSLAFTVLGVNIDRLTSDSGLSGSWVVMVLLLCLVVGAAAFLVANGTGPTSRRRGRD